MIDGVSTDPATSQRFRRELDLALRGRVLDGGGLFCCPSGTACRESVGSDGFAGGQLSYVGDHYDAATSDGPFRILVVSMQVGDDEAPVTMARRREQIRTRIPEQFGQRNQHMAGVTTDLRVLFGGRPGDDRAGEYLRTPLGDVHVLDAYAMANSVLCSRRPGSGREGAPTATMIRNCSDNLRSTIDTLQPTIIHSQGRSQSGWSTHQAIETLADKIEPIDEYNSRIRFGNSEAVWCSLKHPARNWGQLGRAYFREVAWPALLGARAAALDLPPAA